MPHHLCVPYNAFATPVIEVSRTVPGFVISIIVSLWSLFVPRALVDAPLTHCGGYRSLLNASHRACLATRPQAR